MSTKLLASAPTFERLKSLVSQYLFCPTLLILHPNGDIETGRGISISLRWELKKKRYRLVEIQS